MADRSGNGSYTPNRKPRRGRGTGSTPRGSPRGRGQSGGDTPATQSPSITTTTSNTPASGEEQFPIVAQVDSPSSTPSRQPADESQNLETKSSISESIPASSKEKSVVSEMESPINKATTSALSDETFLTPPSTTDTKGDKKTIESAEKPQSLLKTAKPAEPAESISEPLNLEKTQADQKSSSSAPSIPEKPPRKISVEKAPKVFTPEVEKPKSPRLTEVPLTVDIETEKIGEMAIKQGPSSAQSSIPSPMGRRPSGKTISPSGFAYGLGGPIGRPGYGIVSHDHDPPDDHWPIIQARASRVSIAEIRTVAKGFSKRQWITLVIFGMADLFCAMVISLQAPFYPPEAELKGATATEYGFVFGIYELTVFLLSPIYGKYMNKLGPRLVFNLGIATTAISCICFGFLDKLDSHFWFIGLSFLLRITEAIGASAFVTSAFTIIAVEFPESVSTTFASLETFFGLGLIIGPTVGGALYQVGGFLLPFLTTGVGLLVIAVAACFVMPKIETVSDEDGTVTEGYGIFSILKIPGVLIAAISIALTANSLAFLSATLEPHLRQFALSPLQTGLMFIINGGVYAMTAPVFGFLCDKTSKPVLLTLLGAVLIFIAFLIIGPIPFIPINTILWLTGVGLFIQGVGLAATLVSGFISALRDSMDYGFPDNISTYGVVSGMWTSALSLGAFIGPSAGGFLLDTFNFRNATYYILVTQGLMILLIVTYLIAKPKSKSNGSSSESAPLLRPISPLGQKKDIEVPTASTSKVGYGAIGESEA